MRRGNLRLEERQMSASGPRFVAALHLPRKLLPLSPLLPALTWGRGSLLALPRCRAASPSSPPAEELVAVPTPQTRGALSCISQQAAKGRFSPRHCWSLLLPAAQLGHFGRCHSITEPQSALYKVVAINLNYKVLGYRELTGTTFNHMSLFRFLQ